MKKGKYSRKTSRKLNARFVAVLVSVTLICAAVVGTTLAYLSDETTDVENTFIPSQVTSKVVEDSFDGTTKSSAKIQNTGDISAFIRADIVVTWMDENGNVLSEVPVIDTNYTITIGSDWFQKDGYYYWPNVVAANDMTGDLITTANANVTKDVNGTTYYLSIEILSSAIQSDPATAVEQAWGVTVGTDGKLSAN